MKGDYQVLANSLPEELENGLMPTVYNVKLTLRSSAVEYGDSSLPIDEVQNNFETMRKKSLDAVLGLCSGNLTTENNFSEENCLQISSLGGHCTGVQVIEKPQINPETKWLTNFGIKNDTLSYGSRNVSGSNQTPKGFVNIEFIGYSPKK